MCLTVKVLSAASRRPWIPIALAIALGAGGLVISNPSPADLETFGSERLVDEISKELCSGDGLPMVMRLTLSNCNGLVHDQREALGRLVRDQARRQNFGLFSIYRADIGGQSLLHWQVPRFHATVLAIAGTFVLLESGQDINPPHRAS
jgi:hypothetical protein